MTSKLEYSRGESIAGKYEVIDVLGETALAVHYRVKHVESGTFLRLLLLRPEVAGLADRERIIAAFQKARSVRHENLLKIGELAEAGGVAYVTMEDFAGTTLRDLLQQHRKEDKRFDVRRAAQIQRGILEGLTAIHGAGSVLRDLRPEGVVISSDRTKGALMEVKIVGAFLTDLVPIASLVEDEFTRGDAQYLAPELKSFDPDPSARSDVWSAGVVLYEMLVGAPPVGTFQLPRSRRPDLPRHLDTVCELALAHAPEDRYPTPDAFADDLRRTFEAGSDDAATTGRRSVLGTVLFAGGALLAVALVAVIAFALRSDPAQEAAALDSQVRAQVLQDHDRPSDAEIKSVTGRHPPNMVFVPAGPFVRGRLHAESSKVAPPNEPLAEVVDLPGFLIDAFEAPNLKDSVGSNKVRATEAEAACAAAGKRLCTADEWEKACKGPKNTVYSWGDAFDPAPCGQGLEEVGASGARADCRSGWGVFDLSGNHREWTASPPAGAASDRRLVKGGLKGNPEKGARCAFSTDLGSGYKDDTLSFRCCRDLDAPPPGEPPAPEGTPPG